MMVLLMSLISFSVSNIGLESIIKFAVPVLNFIYPLALVHVFIGLLVKNWEEKGILLHTTLAFSMFASVFEALKSVSFLNQTKLFSVYLKKLPLSSLGLSWIPFAILGFMVGTLLSRQRS